MSMPRAAMSVATMNATSPLRIFAITRSRSFCGRSPLSTSESKPLRLSTAFTSVVSSRVLQKMIAFSGSSFSST